MVTPSAGGIVLVPFPLDLSQAKLRPAVALAAAGRGHWILCQVTSNPYGDPRGFLLPQASFASRHKPGELLAPARERERETARIIYERYLERLAADDALN